MSTKVKKSVWARLGILVCCFLLLFSMAACSSEKKHYEECVEILRERLIDPTSLLIAEADSIQDPEGKDIAYRIVYNAKNKYGGYVGNETVYFLYDSETDKVSMGGTASLNYGTWGIAGGKTKSYVD